MRTYLARCTLRNGARTTLHVLATSSCAAILVAIDTFGETLRTCSCKPA